MKKLLFYSTENLNLSTADVSKFIYVYMKGFTCYSWNPFCEAGASSMIPDQPAYRQSTDQAL